MQVILNGKMILDTQVGTDLEWISKEMGVSIDEFEIIYTKEEKQLYRKKLLSLGTKTKDGRFFFTERTAEKFVMDYASLDDNEKLIWKDTSKNIVELTKEEAKPYIQEIKTILREIYGLS